MQKGPIRTMQPESLAKLVGSGNTATVEEEWLKLLESPGMTPASFHAYHVVLSELAKAGKTQQAEVLATTALETFGEGHDERDTVRMASAFLVAVGESASMRKLVTDLYKSTFSDREHLDELLKITGLAGGRPVRRALRALDVCLSVDAGDYLADRDDESAAKIESVEFRSWEFEVTNGEEVETLDALSLADRYRKASPTEFAVVKHFSPDQLVARMQQDPGSFVLDMCLQRGGKIDSVVLESVLVPEVFTSDEFEKWWAKARTAIRKQANLKMEGRSPYYISHVETSSRGGDEFATEFRRQRDPFAQLECVERYLKDCKTKGITPSADLLRNALTEFRSAAARSSEKGGVMSLIQWLLTWRMGQIAGEPETPEQLLQQLAVIPDLAPVFRRLENDILVEMACDALVASRTDWPDQLLNLLPLLPAGVCDQAVERLLKAGRPISDIHAVVQRILSLPIESFDALLWLWDGPKNDEVLEGTTPVTVLTRILRALDDCRRDDRVPRALAKKLANRARSVLGARRYERFVALVKSIDRGMAVALRSQIAQLDNLGRSVPEDMITHLSRAFPMRDQQPIVPAWQREDILFVTEAGMTRKRAEIDHHVNVKMRDNARAIGAAAEHGDLSENSEYKFALEERDLLRARLGQMNTELSMAKVVAPSSVATDRVSFGTRVVFHRVGDGAEYEMTFVGPWEADHSRGLFNYRAPLAQAIFGKQIGDLVEFEHGETSGQYRIAAIHNGLEHLDIKAFEAPMDAHNLESHQHEHTTHA